MDLIICTEDIQNQTNEENFTDRIQEEGETCQDNRTEEEKQIRKQEEENIDNESTFWESLRQKCLTPQLNQCGHGENLKGVYSHLAVGYFCVPQSLPMNN